MSKLQIPISLITVGERMRKDYGDIEELAESLSEHGLIQPVVINQNNELIAGGRRLAAARALGWEEIPVVYLETLDKRQLRKLELEENVRRKEMTWQERCLSIYEIHHLHMLDHAIEGEDWGYRETGELLGIRSVGDVHNALHVAKALVDKDEEISKCENLATAVRLLITRKEDQANKRMLELMPKSVSSSNVKPILVDSNAPTDLSETINLQRICHNGDVLSLLGAHPFHHIICDPPYAIDMDMLAQENTGMQNISRVEIEHQVGSNLHLLSSFVQATADHLPDGGFLIMWCDYLRFEFLHDCGINAGLAVQRWPLVWFKTTPCINQSAQYNWTKNHEAVIIMRKPGATLLKAQPTSVISGPNARDPVFRHPFAKPMYVWRWLMDAVASKGQTILDPFAGEGSSTLAAIEGGYVPLAYELNYNHYAALVQNVKNQYIRLLGPNTQFI